MGPYIFVPLLLLIILHSSKAQNSSDGGVNQQPGPDGYIAVGAECASGFTYDSNLCGGDINPKGDMDLSPLQQAEQDFANNILPNLNCQNAVTLSNQFLIDHPLDVISGRKLAEKMRDDIVGTLSFPLPDQINCCPPGDPTCMLPPVDSNNY